MMYLCLKAGVDLIVVDSIAAIHARQQLEAEGKIKPLPEVSRNAADRCYVETAVKLADGLQRVVNGYEKSGDAQKKRILEIWRPK